MKVFYRKRAKNAILKVMQFVEDQNTPYSGDRWFEKLDAFITSIAASKATFQNCKDPLLAKYKFQCYTYGEWIIVFKTSSKQFEVCRFILGKKLNYQ